MLIKTVTHILTILTYELEAWNVLFEILPALSNAHIGTSAVNISLDRVGFDVHGLWNFMNGIAHPMKVAYIEFGGS